MEKSILDKIEQLRCQMVEVATERGSLTDEKVVAISQQLDVYIVSYHKMMRRRLGKRNHVINNWQIKAMKHYEPMADRRLSAQVTRM